MEVNSVAQYRNPRAYSTTHHPEHSRAPA